MNNRVKILGILMLTLSIPAHAYIDPGSGSAIMSAIIGFFVAIGVLLKTFWYKIKGIFTSNKKQDAIKAEGSSDNNDSK